MANKKITDLMSGTPVRDSLLESAIDISGTMDSRKVKAGLVADLASANVASPYDDTVTYAIGQYCLYEGNIYRCIAITTGAFDATAWTQIVVTGEYRRVVELLSAQYAQLTPAEQNNGTIYVKTDEETTAADIPYAAGVSVADKIDEIVANANTVHQYTASYTHASITQGNIYAYSVGKIYMLTGYMRANAQIASDTVVGSVTGVTLANEIFASSVGSSGSTLRLMSYTDGRLRLEKTMPANEWFSFTMIGFLA